MKYLVLKKNDRKSLHIKAQEKGINMAEETDENGELKEAKNVIFENGVLKTRKGLVTDTDSIFEIDTEYAIDTADYSFTDVKYFYNGEEKQLAYSKVVYSGANEMINVYLVGSDRSADFIGYMNFTPLDSTTFYRPINVLFFVGKPKTGGGIYCIVTLKNDYDGKTEYRFYEVASNFSSWSHIYDYYTPTVMINGRGDRYETAADEGLISDSKPQTLQALNILSGGFSAYYTSDGYSSAFKLPFINLDNSTVKCRVNVSPENYTEWTVLANSTVSSTQTFYGKQIKIKVDRTVGTVYFCEENDIAFSVPVFSICGNNNLKITASKGITGGYSSVASCKSVTACDSKIIFSSGLDGNKIYVSSFENPLYFSEMNTVKVGTNDLPVTALKSDGSKIFAFKEREIYEILIKGEKRLNKTALTADNDEKFYSDIEFSNTCVCRQNGTSNPNSIAFISGKPIWQSADGGIYFLDGNNKAKLLSSGIMPFLKNVSPNERLESRAAVCGNIYLLTVSDKTVVIKFGDGNYTPKVLEAASYIWEFPNEFLIQSVINFNGNFWFVCKEQQSLLGYISSLDGDKDLYLQNDTSLTLNQKEIPTELSFRAKLLQNDMQDVFLHFAFLRFSAQKGSKIKFQSRNIVREFSVYDNETLHNKMGETKFLVDMNRVNYVDISLLSGTSLAFGGVDFYYTKSEI